MAYKLIINSWNLEPVVITKYNPKTDQYEKKKYKPLSFPNYNYVEYNINDDQYLNSVINEKTKHPKYKYQVNIYEGKKLVRSYKINW